MALVLRVGGMVLEVAINSQWGVSQNLSQRKTSILLSLTTTATLQILDTETELFVSLMHSSLATGIPALMVRVSWYSDDYEHGVYQVPRQCRTVSVG